MKLKVAWWAAVPREERDAARAFRIITATRMGVVTPDDVKWLDDRVCWADTPIITDELSLALSRVRGDSYRRSTTNAWWLVSKDQSETEEFEV